MLFLSLSCGRWCRVGRRPEVFVRALSMPEGQRLQRITRTAKDPVKLRRAIVVLMSAQGQPQRTSRTWSRPATAMYAA
ncbi:hypothetical protein [Micromonospora craterilacus]|uniref:hypothetical protein n=1 Tax=Micromonospora craterilacus TaxID=1655439 RepID=UPI001F275537|nr:hypothetical protein [Micromonospora craterilacus]